MRRHYAWITIVLLILLVVALIKGSSVIHAQEFPPGTIIDSVFCKKDSSQSYALYLPSSYDPGERWPAVFIFDPGARGKLPVEKFRAGAEQLGYILVGSNNSKNGSWDIAFNAGDAMFQDVLQRFAVDPQRVYTSGFSGGSRVATSVAVITGKVAGVIACGAGYANVPQYQPSAGSNFSYCALVGNQDMNYQELLAIEIDLNKKKINNDLIIFPATHQWPPSSYLTEALYWLELQAFKNKKQVSANFKPADLYTMTKHRADSLYDHEQLFSALKIYQHIVRDFDEVVDISDVSDRIIAIENSKEYRKQQRSYIKVNQEELQYRNKLGEAYTELTFTRLKVANDSSLKDMAWWHNEIDYLKHLSQRNDVDKKNMALRLLNMVSAMCAESSFHYADAGDYELAMILNRIWLYVDPESAWGHWSMAKLCARTNDFPEMMTHLRIAVKHFEGYLKAIKREPLFQPFMNTPEMTAFMKEMQ